MDLATWAIFTGVAAAAILSPGPAILLAITNGATVGLRGAALGALGNLSAVAIVATVSALGLGALLLTSETLFLAMKLLGAVYLGYLGLRLLFARVSLASPEAEAARPRRPWRLYTQALAVGLGNPKLIAFFTALFPQFLDSMQPLLPQFTIMTLTFMVCSFASLMGYATFASRARLWLAKEQVRRWFNRVSGLTFVAFGIKLATLSR